MFKKLIAIGWISFSEFLIGYCLSASGDLKTRFEYAFSIYDADKNGVLSLGEIKSILAGILTLMVNKNINFKKA